MASDLISIATDASFQADVLDSDKLVLVDFWATWCAPCRALVPHLERLASEHVEQLQVVKLDIQANMQTAMKFGVSNLPTLLLFKGGEVIDRKVGTNGGYDAIQQMVTRHSA